MHTYMPLLMLSVDFLMNISRADTNTNNREYSIILVVFVNITLVSNTRYIILWGISA